MTTPHDDELRTELLSVPDHGPDFWAALDTDLAAEEREDVVPLATAPSARPRGRGLLLAAAVLAVLGGIGAWFALSGDDDGPDVAVDPEPSVTTAPDPTTPPTTVGEAVPETGVQSLSATVERTSATGLAGTFSLVADEDGTIVLRNDDAEYGYHAPSGATWQVEGDISLNEIDPIHGRGQLEFLLYLDLAESVRYGGLGTAADRDGRSTIEATVELADNESAGWFGRTATLTVDFQTGFVLDVTVSDATGDVVEELHVTDIVWSEEPAGVSGAVGMDSDWTVTDGLPAEAVVGERYLVPEGIGPVRTFTTDAPVQSGSEAGNPMADGAYVIDVATTPWHHSKIVVLGRTPGEWQDPLAEEGWVTEPESVRPGGGVLAGIDGELIATPPQPPRAWFDLAPTEVVAIDGLVDPTTAQQLWSLESAWAVYPPNRGLTVEPPPLGAESAFSFLDEALLVTSGSVVARRVEGGAAEATAWSRAVDGIFLEPGGAGIEPPGMSAEACPCPLDTGDAHAVVLLDAYLDDDGEIAVIYGDVPAPDGPQPAETSLWLQRFGRPHAEAIELGGFTGPEYGVNSAKWGGDRIVISAGADLGEVFSFVDLEGNEIDEPNNPVPVGHRYNEPPFYEHGALDRDGRKLAFVEGPDFDRYANDIVGDYSLVVVDLETGEEIVRSFLGERGTMRVSFVDFDGEWALVSRTEDTGDPTTDDPISALGVDTIRDGTVIESGVIGVATLVTTHR